MALQSKFWRGESMRHHGREDNIRGNREAPEMHNGPGASDEDDMTGAGSPKLGTSQPRTKGGNSDELPLRHAHVKPRSQRHQVLMAHALRQHGRQGADGTTMGTAVGGGAAGGGAGS